MIDIESMTLIELKELAKKHNIKNISKLKKDELVTVLKQIGNKAVNTEISETTTLKTEEKEPVERQYDENRRTNCGL